MKQHNTDNLTPDQIALIPGLRLLDADESRVDRPMPPLPQIFCWRNGIGWVPGYSGRSECYTSATTLTRAELRAARGLPPEPEYWPEGFPVDIYARCKHCGLQRGEHTASGDKCLTHNGTRFEPAHDTAHLDARAREVIADAESIRKDHAAMAAHNEGVLGMPYGPCECQICAPRADPCAPWPAADLAPCPFCGVDPDYLATGSVSDPLTIIHRVMCIAGSCETHPFTGWRATKDEAFAAWNTQTHLSAARSEIENFCREIGEKFGQPIVRLADAACLLGMQHGQISNLRAEIERLTKERDEAKARSDCWFKNWENYADSEIALIQENDELRARVATLEARLGAPHGAQEAATDSQRASASSQPQDDTKRLDFLQTTRASIWPAQKEGLSFTLFARQAKGYPLQPTRDSLREAIDAAMTQASA